MIYLTQRRRDTDSFKYLADIAGDTTTAQCIAGDTTTAQCIAGDWVTSLIVSRFYHQLMS
ncbi:MAG: hypothetical protein KA716_31020 [Gloeotrichia echinulata DEX184]|nr:hypothetical protein [Gloeotrichia echinulata DEX184]